MSKARNKTLEKELGVLSDEEIKQCNDLQNALELINQENIVTSVEPLEMKKFVVDKNKDLDVSKTEMGQKSEAELDEIANQADQAFYDLMDIAINSTGKACGDIASAANSFLTIKLNSRLAKMDNKLKQQTYELNKLKFEASQIKNASKEDDEPEDDGIIFVED